MAGTHSLLAPSAAHRWMRCPGSLALTAGVEDKTSSFAAEGTVAHLIADKVLSGAFDDETVLTLVGETIEADGFKIKVTKDMIEHVLDFVRLAREYAEGGTLMSDQKVDFSAVVGFENSTGTSDVVIVHPARGDQPARLTVIDLKFGVGVKVDAFYSERITIPGPDGPSEVGSQWPNEQMALYGLGALEDFGFLEDIKEVVLVIHQPRLNHVSEYSLPVSELISWGEKAKGHAQRAVGAMEEADVPPEVWEAENLVPGSKQCRFCDAKAVCPALQREVDETVIDDFKDIAASLLDEDKVAHAMDRVDAIEQWCKAVRAEVERRLLAGQPVRGYKLVEGQLGNRAWVNESEAEAKLKSFRLKQTEMYKSKLISPTDAEKLLKKNDPARWDKLQSLINRAKGKPSVAPATDPRPALAVTPIAEEFGDLIAQGN